MKVILICHDSEPLNREGMARWLASFAEVAGIVELRENKRRLGKRMRAEIRRNGWLRFADVLLFRTYYTCFMARKDQKWEQALLGRLRQDYPPVPQQVPVLVTASPNQAEVRDFIQECQPDIVIARCKMILKEDIFTIPKDGTYVMHPGICPEYRNAHGCFWAIANGDLENVGMTLLRIDQGIDTGPVYGYYKVESDPSKESHRILQQRVVFENLNELKDKLYAIHSGTATPLETGGRTSAVWGQPWFSKYLAYRQQPRVNPS